MDLTYIRALAEEYALKYNPDQVAPFPYENITGDIDDLEIHFVALDDDTAMGVTLFKDGKFTILVNNNESETQQYFALAHGLGHYLLHQAELRRQHVIIDEGNLFETPISQDEVEASNFAISLLLPTDLVRRAWHATKSVQACARIFKVSVLLISIRLTQLGLVEE
jgi:Zn-dependent peptidase ImmA (M78 family)